MERSKITGISLILFLGITLCYSTNLSVASVGEASTDASGDINDDGIVDIFDVVTLAVAFGSIPGDPNWNPVADLNIDKSIDILDVVLVSKKFGNLVFSQLKTFSSREELENFLKAGMEQAKQFENLPQFSFLRGDEVSLLLSPAAESAPEHSTTNIQVEGVDESDIVKTDGEHLYVVSGQTVYILKAYPPNQAVVLSRIELNETYSSGIYVYEDRLVVLGNNYRFLPYADPSEFAILPYMYPEEVFIKVYNITDRENPVLARMVVLNGSLSGSRMIGNHVYAVVNQPALHPNGNFSDLEVILPRISGDYVKEVEPIEIRYVDVPDVFYYFTTVVAINIVEDAKEPTYETFLAGLTAVMYVSLSNMYLVVPNTNAWILSENTVGAREETLIYRVKLNGERMVVKAEGGVSGYVLNQFSMDEYSGFFRVATTKWTSNGSVNNLFVLNMSLGVVGKLEDLAPGERIYSARFMGDRCYLVTFREIDPFFVIDVGNSTEPKVLGYLKIPGFSGYLHPYDENHIIGVGKEDDNVKLSLFNVTDVTKPTETAKYVVQADWSDSTVLWDHKAFLFDKPKQLLALPVSINRVWMYHNKHFWQGAYIFDVSLQKGFTLKGNITHQNFADQFESNLEVKRTLYIENVLYTISEKKIKINNLESLTEIKEVVFS